MAKHVGLLMVRNEADVIAEAMAYHTHYFDAIVAMDGSTDGSREIVRRCPKVVKLFCDEEILKPGERWTDGHRNVALQWIAGNFGVENVWITLLHADEFWEDEPIEAAERAAAEKATHVTWAEYRFFLHSKDRESWSSDKTFGSDFTHGEWTRLCSVVSRVRWYCGPWFEERQFHLMNHQVLIPGKNHCTLPRGIGAPRRASFIPRYRHYPYRSPEQALRCYQEKVVDRYWQPDHAWLKAGDPFVDCLPKPRNSPLAHWNEVGKYDGTLPESESLEPKWWKRPGVPAKTA